MSSRMRLNSYLLPAIVCLLFVAQLVDPSRVWTVLLIGLGGLWLISYVWARQLAKSLNIIREMRYGWVQVGDSLEERFTLENESILPAAWVEVEDRSTLPGYNASMVTGADANASNQWRKKGTCGRRGLYQLGDTLLHASDPFGIYSVTVSNSMRASMLVMPPVVPLPMLEIVPGGLNGDGRPLPHSPVNTVDASSVREYIPGDSVRLVHWKTTAHQGKPFVRLFDGAPAGDWVILLDLQDAAQVGRDENSTEEHGVILAASLADRGLRTHFGVGLVVNGQPLEWLAPRFGMGQRWEILRVLALTSRGPTSLCEVLKHVRSSLPRNSSLLIITPTVETNWLQTLPGLRRRGITPTIFSLNSRSSGGPASNETLLNALHKMGVRHHDIPREMLDRPEAHPGFRGQWEWKVSPTGRAIPLRAPDDYAWRRLSG